MPEGPSRLQSWFAELRRRKVFRVAVAYVLAAWALIQVADAIFEPLGLPGWSMKLLIVLVALGFPLACTLAWAYDMTPHGLDVPDASDRARRGRRAGASSAEQCDSARGVGGDPAVRRHEPGA